MAAVTLALSAHLLLVTHDCTFCSHLLLIVLFTPNAGSGGHPMPHVPSLGLFGHGVSGGLTLFFLGSSDRVPHRKIYPRKNNNNLFVLLNFLNVLCVLESFFFLAFQRALERPFWPSNFSRLSKNLRGVGEMRTALSSWKVVFR